MTTTTKKSAAAIAAAPADTADAVAEVAEAHTGQTGTPAGDAQARMAKLLAGLPQLDEETRRLHAVAEILRMVGDIARPNILKNATAVVSTKSGGSFPYKYIPIEDIIRECSKACDVLGVAILAPAPASVIITRSAVGGKTIVILRCVYRVLTPAGSVEFEVESEGVDSGDKATTKAWTYALRILYTQLFKIYNNGDDPERVKEDLSEPRMDDRAAQVLRQADDIAAKDIPGKRKRALLYGLASATKDFETVSTIGVKVRPPGAQGDNTIYMPVGAYLRKLTDHVDPPPPPAPVEHDTDGAYLGQY
jgi:hypothetical protein